MGGVDKGWVEWQGRPLIEVAIERFAPQLERLLISANRNLERYRALGFEVVEDAGSDFRGPLAGIAAALACCDSTALYVVPCDSPNLPLDLCQQLDQSAADIAYLKDQQRAHYLHARIRASLRADLQDTLNHPEHNGAVRLWYDAHQAQPVQARAELQTLDNINHPQG